LLEWDAKIPPFPEVHAEVLKARNYMAARLDPPRHVSTPTSGETVGVSNPVSFLVAEVSGTEAGPVY
jgi:hypothetical protein